VNIKTLGVSLALAGAVSLPAAAEDVYYDTARVIAVTPQTERVNMPRQECRTEYVRESRASADRDLGGAIIGGIAGGLLGSQIGKGNGRVAGAAVGAATGAIVGDRIDNSGERSYSTRPVERCVTVDDWQTVQRGYQVTYRFNGREYTTQMPYDPGSTLRIRVAVSPEEDRRISFLEPAYRYDNGRHRGWERRGKHGKWDD